MKYDTTFKDLFPDVKALFRLLTHSDVVSMESTEYATVRQRRADLVARLANQQLLHLEIQSDNDDEMVWRELEYCGLIAQTHHQIPLQIVLYVGAAPARFDTEIDTTDLKYRYHLIDIKELDCTSLLESDSLNDNLLSLLGKLADKAEAVRRVMYKIAHLSQNARDDMLKKLMILTGLRPTELPKLIQKEAIMPITVDLEKNPLFMEILERYAQESERRGELRGELRGEQRGEQRARTTMLQRLLEKRFGELPVWVNHRLEHATVQELELWSLQLFDATCLEDIFKTNP